MRPLAQFITKTGKVILIFRPSLDRAKKLLEFVNRLTAEDTFLSFTGRQKTLSEEIDWIKLSLRYMSEGKSYVIWAVYGDQIIGSCDILRGGSRDWHVGKIGLMVDKNYRRGGIGR